MTQKFNIFEIHKAGDLSTGTAESDCPLFIYQKSFQVQLFARVIYIQPFLGCLHEPWPLQGLWSAQQTKHQELTKSAYRPVPSRAPFSEERCGDSEEQSVCSEFTVRDLNGNASLFSFLMLGLLLQFRSVFIGLVVGCLLCFTNLYFGLQTGAFKSIESHHKTKRL